MPRIHLSDVRGGACPASWAAPSHNATDTGLVAAHPYGLAWLTNRALARRLLVAFSGPAGQPLCDRTDGGDLVVGRPVQPGPGRPAASHRGYVPAPRPARWGNMWRGAWDRPARLVGSVAHLSRVGRGERCPWLGQRCDVQGGPPCSRTEVRSFSVIPSTDSSPDLVFRASSAGLASTECSTRRPPPRSGRRRPAGGSRPARPWWWRRRTWSRSRRDWDTARSPWPH